MTDKLKQVRDALDFCRFALEPYDDIKPRDWSTDRQNLRFAHEDAVKALATLDTIIAEDAQLQHGWQPIETAPKDGREVILSLWSGSYATPETSFRWAINGYFKNGFWYSKDQTIGRLADPTHWMPIKPPTIKGETK